MRAAGGGHIAADARGGRRGIVDLVITGAQSAVQVPDQLRQR
jgi:hypothetical protein